MSKKRTCVGIRVLSMLLVVVMVLGMAPLSVFAAEANANAKSERVTTTENSVKALREYANKLLSAENFAINKQESHDKSKHYTWDTEGKPDNWRYFNGVMMEAFLMLGAEGSGSGNVLEFVKDYFDTNVNADGTLDKYLTMAGELDAVPPARTLAHLMGTGLEGDGYAEALKIVYDKLNEKTSYTNCGGNFKHKESGWDDFNIGLDGMYMAQPFLMEYANLLEKGVITDSSTTPAAIRKAVSDRFIWVADTMYDETSHLYHHGWNVAKSEGNGAFWSRGIGWYAAALVEVIELMPENSTERATLISKLPKLFDGMMEYRDSTTGLWYNVVDKDSTYSSKNILETSGSALMAYAMMKAYNNGYVNATYGEAGLKAFNSIATTKLKNGQIIDIYKQSGVETTKEGFGTCTVTTPYTKYDNVAEEGKGVGPVLMAAAIANTTALKLEGQSAPAAVVTAGVVHANGTTTAIAGQTNFPTVTATVIDNTGKITDVSASSGLTSTMGDVANGKATVTAAYGDITVGTFEVNAVNPSDPVTANGTVAIESEVTDVPTAPSVTAGTWTEINKGGDGTGANTYVKATAVAPGSYVICASSGARVLSYSNIGKTITPTWTQEGDYYKPDIAVELWELEAYDAANDQYYIKAGNGLGYLVYDGDNYPSVSTDKTKGVWTVTVASGNFHIVSVSSTGNKNLNIQSGNGVKLESSAKSLWLMSPVASGDPKYGLLSGTATYVYPVGTTTDILAQIQSDYKIQTSANADGTNPTDVLWDDSTVSYRWDTALDTTKAGTYTLTVNVDGKPIGYIPVLIYGNKVTKDYTVSLSVVPSAIVATAGDSAITLNPTVTVEGLTGYTSTVTYGGGADGIATVNADGKVTIAGKGTTTITVTVPTITYNGTEYTVSNATVSIPVTVNEAVQEITPPTLTITSDESGTTTVEAGKTLQLTVTASTGTLDGGTITWSSKNPSVATVVADSGLVTGVSAGTAIITATWTVNSRAASDTATATFEVTVTGASSGEGAPTVTIDTVYQQVTSITSDISYFVIERGGHTASYGTNDTPGAIAATATKVSGSETYKFDQVVNLWTFEKISGTTDSYYIYYTDSTGAKHYLNGDGTNTPKTSTTQDTQWKVSFVADGVNISAASGPSGDGRVDLSVASTGPKFETSKKALVLYTPASPDVPTPTYSAAVSADPTEITLGGTDVTSTLTASMSEDTTDITDTATFAWSITSGAEFGELNATTGSSVTLTGKAAGDVVIEVTATAPSGDTATATVTVKVNAAVTPGPEPSGPATYVLDVDDIDVGKEYLIVAKVGGQYYAMKNVSSKVGGKTKAEVLPVTVNGQTITIANESDAKLSEWIFGGKAGQVEIKNVNGNPNPVYVNLANDGYGINTSSKNTYVEAITGTPGAYYIRKEANNGAMLYCDGQNFVRKAVATPETDEACKILLFKKRDISTAISVTSDVGMDLFAETTLTPTVLYKGNLAVNPTLLWESDNTNVVTVENGKLTAVGSGTAKVTVTLDKEDGVEVTGNDRVTATVNVTVATVKLTISQQTLGLYLDPKSEADSPTVVHKSKLTEKTLTVNVASGTTAWDGQKTIVWSSSHPEYATVDENGFVKAVALGTTTITATLTEFNGKTLTTPISVSCEVTVGENGVKEIELNPRSVTVVWDNDKETTDERNNKVRKALGEIVVTITYYDGSSFNRSLKYLFDDPRATVSSNYRDIVHTNVKTPTEYTVKVSIEGTYHTYNRNVTVRVIDPNMLNADGIVAKETSLKYKLATEIVDGKEYIIVAFPTTGDKTNGVALSNGNATNKDPAKPYEVNVKVETGSDGYTTITLPADRKTDGLMKWTFSAQTAGNWYVYNFLHRLCVSDRSNILQARYGESTDANRLYATKVGDAFYLTKNAWKAGEKNDYVSLDSGWKGKSTNSPTELNQQLYLYERVTTTENIPVSLTVSPTTVNLHMGLDANVSASVLVGGEPATQWNLEWTSADPTIATVDNSGKVVPVKAGVVELTATLYMANNMEVIATNGALVTKKVTVNVSDKAVTYSVKNPNVTTRLGGRPDYSTVQVWMNCEDHGDTPYSVFNPNVELDPLSAVAEDKKTSKPLNLMEPGTYYVPAYYLKNFAGYVAVTVSTDPYYGLTATSAFPEYPDVGGIRIRKFGTGGQKFFDTGLANVELQVAGVSGKSNVDVVLVVDVSNSMAWSMNWFEGMSDDQVKAADDPDKIPASNADPDKLDMAMSYAQEFADTLLGNGQSGNTLSFVTFAGNDLDHRADGSDCTNYADSVKTVFTSVKDPAAAKNSFAGTKFTQKTVVNGTKVECKLAIAGVDGQPFSDANGSKPNRGNTNYDYAFGQAMAAVEQVKSEYSAANGGKSYADSGRQIHVVFMTDGAPSHYNGVWNTTNKQADVYATLWGTQTGERFDAENYENKNDKWLEFIGWYNRLATELYSQVTEMHVVGFDLAHGGFGSFTSDAASLNKVLRGLVQNRVLDSVQADDANALHTFFTDLAANLTYSATSSKVTDTLGDDFVLYTGAQGVDATKAVPPQIVVTAHDLWKASDVGTGEGQCTQEQVGERNGESEDLEVITFSENGTVAVSGQKPGVANILTFNEDGTPKSLDGKYVTYDFATKTFTWTIGNVEDKEYTLTYWAYLKNSVVAGEDADGNPVYATSGRHDTNKKATLDYVDINGKRASRVFPVPQVAWQEANIGVRFFLVDKDGNYINSAGQKFTEKANRVFLSTRKYYQYTLNTPFSRDVPVIFADAALGSSYSLYKGDGATVTVNHSTNPAISGSASITQADGGKISAFDLNTNSETTGDFLHTIVDIPVVLENYGTADSPLNTDTVVMDYGLPMPIDVLSNDADRKATNQAGVEVPIALEVLGFVPYDANAELSNYVGGHVVKESLDGVYGTFTREKKTVGEKEIYEVLYTPSKIMNGMEKVFVAVKVIPTDGQESASDFKILLNPLTIMPATSVYYETDNNMKGAFKKTGIWRTDGISTVTERQDYYSHDANYGYDKIYFDCNTYSNDSAFSVIGGGKNNTYVTFSFTGTGFDLISRTGKDQGVIYVTVRNVETNEFVAKRLLVNTATTELYQIPVVSEVLPYGNYMVTVSALRALTKPDGNGGTEVLSGTDFCFDAVRITGALANDENAKAQYAVDNEANVSYNEIRDMLIKADDFYAGGATSGGFFMDLDEGQKDPENPELDVQPNISNYTNFGPKNEVYLSKDNAIAFKVTNLTNLASIQIGAKSASDKPVTMQIRVQSAKNGTTEYDTKEVTLTTATDMFYALPYNSTWDTTDGIIVIVTCKEDATKTGGILSLTHLKTTYHSPVSDPVNVVADAQTYVAARNFLAPSYDVQAASFDEDTAMALDTTTMSVVTTNLVDSLTVIDSLGNEIPASATYLETEMGERIWTVTLRTANLGEVSYTVIGHGASGQTGDTITDHILVSY